MDCAVDDSQKFAAEFRGHYYKMATELELGIFLENPSRYSPPLVNKQLPPEELLPMKLTGSDVKEMFPVQIEMLGYCPVTYLDGDLRYLQFCLLSILRLTCFHEKPIKLLHARGDYSSYNICHSVFISLVLVVNVC